MTASRIDRAHLVALELRLSHERSRFAKACNPQAKALRAVYVQGIEKEIAAEKKFLGIVDVPIPDMSDDELMRLLGL